MSRVQVLSVLLRTGNAFIDCVGAVARLSFRPFKVVVVCMFG